MSKPFTVVKRPRREAQPLASSTTDLLPPSRMDRDAVANEIRSLILSFFSVLLKSPQEASVAIIQGDKTTVMEVDIRQEDFGRLLGSRGKNIGALRTLIAAMGATHNVRVILSVRDEERFL